MELGGRLQARLGEVHDVLALPGLAAWTGPSLIGLATYRRDGERAELAVLAVAGDVSGHGVGGLLLEAVVSAVSASGAGVLWLVTTNDDLDALRLYQRHRFRLTELRAGAVDRAHES